MAPNLRSGYKAVNLADKPPILAAEADDQSQVDPKTKKGKSIVESKEEFGISYMHEHEVDINSEYDEHGEMREEILSRLKGVKSTLKGGKRVMNRIYVQEPYIDLKKCLAENKEVDSTLAETVRIMSTGQEYTSSMMMSLFKAGWNPLKVHLPIATEKRKFDCREDLIRLSAELSRKHTGIEVDVDALIEASKRAHDDHVASGNNDHRDDDQPKADKEVGFAELLSAVDELRSDHDELRSDNDDIKRSMARLAAIADYNSKNTERVLNAVNQVGPIVDNINSTQRQLLAGAGVAQGLGAVVATPAADDGNANNAQAVQPAPAPNNGANPPDLQQMGFNQLGATYVDPVGGHAMTAFMDTNSTILNHARGAGTEVSRKVDDLSAAIQALHLSGEHDRMEKLINLATRIEGAIIKQAADQQERLISLRSSIDTLKSIVDSQIRMSHPQPSNVVASPGFRQSTPHRTPSGQNNGNINASGDGGGGGGPQQQNQYSGQSAPAPQATSRAFSVGPPQQQPATKGSLQTPPQYPPAAQSNPLRGLQSQPRAFSASPFLGNQFPQLNQHVHQQPMGWSWHHEPTSFPGNGSQPPSGP